MRSFTFPFSMVPLLAACSAGVADTRPTVRDDAEAYPVFVDPMTLGEAIPPYKWPSAIEADGTERSLDLVEVFLDTDEDVAWSPFEKLLFVSIPAW